MSVQVRKKKISTLPTPESTEFKSLTINQRPLQIQQNSTYQDPKFSQDPCEIFTSKPQIAQNPHEIHQNPKLIKTHMRSSPQNKKFLKTHKIKVPNQ